MTRVLVAGIAGASLGTEIAKSLKAASGYHILGCDISNLAFGHYSDSFDETTVVSSVDYAQGVLELCIRRGVEVLIPGGDQPARLLALHAEAFRGASIALAMNDSAVIARLADKAACFEELARLGVEIPWTRELDVPQAVDEVDVPCIVKPSVESGGSAFVFFARTRQDLKLYAEYMRSVNLRPIAQQYVPHERGEFTVGVLSTPEGDVVGTIAMKRAFSSKLSIGSRGADFLISSGYSQGHIDAYPDVCATAAAIARLVGSRGPLNVQGRVDELGRFLPFEINPRFSASTYLRALAGFNEIHWYIQHVLGNRDKPQLSVKAGWYLRSLSEVVVAEGALRA